MKKKYSIAGIIVIDLLSILYGKYFPEQENLIVFLLIAVPFLSYWVFEDTLLLLIFLLINIKIGKNILPTSSPLIQWIFFNPFLTLITILFSVYKVCIFLNNFRIEFSVFNKNREQKDKPLDYYLIVQEIFVKIYPKNRKYALLIAQEFSSIIYSLFLWKSTRYRSSDFTYNKTSGIHSLYIAIISIAVIETFVIHLLLLRFNYTLLSYALLFLNIYTFLGLLGHIKAMNLRPISICKEKIHVRNGLYSQCLINIDNIDCIKKYKKNILTNHKYFKFSLLQNIEPHNMKISLKNSIEVFLFYGLTRNVTEIYIYVDECQGFIEEIEANSPIKLTP